MVDAWLERTLLLIGQEAVNTLKASKVLIVGLGGVGSFAAEFLGRAGIGSMTLVDGDCVDVSNKNRQLIALDSTLGLHKTEVMAQRLLDINKDNIKELKMNTSNLEIFDRCNFILNRIKYHFLKLCMEQERLRDI